MSNKDFDAGYSAGEHLPEQTPVFNERMKRFAKLMQDAGVRLEMIDIATKELQFNICWVLVVSFVATFTKTLNY